MKDGVAKLEKRRFENTVPYRKPGGRKARTPQSQIRRLASLPHRRKYFAQPITSPQPPNITAKKAGFGRFGAWTPWRCWDGVIRSVFAPHRDAGPRLSFLCALISDKSHRAPPFTGWVGESARSASGLKSICSAG